MIFGQRIRVRYHSRSIGVSGKVNTPEERRRWIEAIHEQNHGKCVLSEKGSAIAEALGSQFDKTFVLKTLTDILGVEPVIKDDTYRFDEVKVTFDKDGFLYRMSERSGGAIVIQMEGNHAGDT